MGFRRRADLPVLSVVHGRLGGGASGRRARVFGVAPIRLGGNAGRAGLLRVTMVRFSGRACFFGVAWVRLGGSGRRADVFRIIRVRLRGACFFGITGVGLGRGR